MFHRLSHKIVSNCRPIRSFSKLSNSTHYTKAVSNAQKFYLYFLPNIIVFSTITNVLCNLNEPTIPKITPLEFTIFNICEGILIGVTYPVSYPLLSLSFLYKKYMTATAGSPAENIQFKGD